MKTIDNRPTPLSPWRASALVIVATTSLTFVAAGCTAQVETATPGVVVDDEVEAPAPPAVEVETYPRTEYRGHVVYLVNGRWGYPRDRRWYYYRTEPAQLVRHRAYVQAAPPAHPAYGSPPGEARRVQ